MQIKNNVISKADFEMAMKMAKYSDEMESAYAKEVNRLKTEMFWAIIGLFLITGLYIAILCICFALWFPLGIIGCFMLLR